MLRGVSQRKTTKLHRNYILCANHVDHHSLRAALLPAGLYPYFSIQLPPMIVQKEPYLIDESKAMTPFMAPVSLSRLVIALVSTFAMPGTFWALRYSSSVYFER